MRKVTKKWKMKSGKTIRICDMTDEHLQNAINCVRQHHEKSIESAYALSLMIDSESDGAFVLDQQIDAMERGDASEFFPILNDLNAEAFRRGLVRK